MLTVLTLWLLIEKTETIPSGKTMFSLCIIPFIQDIAIVIYLIK